MFKFIQKRHLMVAFFIIYCFIAFASYWQNLDSFLVFDDIPNLYDLENVHTAKDKLRFSFSSVAGHRYLAYASFALQAESIREQHYFSVKLVNLILHSLSAVFLFIFCIYLQKKLTPNTSKTHNLFIALACSCLWFAHPINVNTVLYTIQRMTVLAGMLTLAGLSVAGFYLSQEKYRSWLSQLVFIAAIYTIAVLAVLSKGTGILLFAFTLLLLAFIHKKAVYYNKKLIATAFILPIIALVIYLIQANKLGFGGRDFTMAQRLYTQPEIINAYIDKILFSWPSKFSLYNDQYPIVNKAYSLRFALPFMVIIGSILLAIKGRKKHPLLAFGVLFFFIGHLLESTIIPLELYFDHRNYIPSAGLILAVVAAIKIGIDSQHRYLKLLALTALIIFSANNLVSTLVEANSWNNKESFIRSNLNDAPFSLRTWQSLAEYQATNGDYLNSVKTLHYIQGNFDYSVANHIHILWQQCIMQQDNAVELGYQRLLESIPARGEVKATSSAMQTLLEVIKNKSCKALSLKQYRKLLQQFIKSPRYGPETFNTHYLMVDSYLVEKDYKGALAASMQMPTRLLKGNFLLMQMRLAFKASDFIAAKDIYQNIKYLSKIDRITYDKQLKEIAHTLKKIDDDASQH